MSPGQDGDVIWDLAYAAWVCVPLWNEEDLGSRGLDQIPDRPGRLAAFVDAYEADDEHRVGLLPTVHLRLAAAIDQARAWAAEGRPGWGGQWSLPEPYGHGGGYRRDVAYLEAHHRELQAALN